MLTPRYPFARHLDICLAHRVNCGGLTLEEWNFRCWPRACLELKRDENHTTSESKPEPLARRHYSIPAERWGNRYSHARHFGRSSASQVANESTLQRV